jgi:hypothetical protein
MKWNACVWKETCLKIRIMLINPAEERFRTAKVSGFEIALPVAGIRPARCGSLGESQ